MPLSPRPQGQKYSWGLNEVVETWIEMSSENYSSCLFFSLFLWPNGLSFLLLLDVFIFLSWRTGSHSLSLYLVCKGYPTILNSSLCSMRRLKITLGQMYLLLNRDGQQRNGNHRKKSNLWYFVLQRPALGTTCIHPSSTVSPIPKG